VHLELLQHCFFSTRSAQVKMQHCTVGPSNWPLHNFCPVPSDCTLFAIIISKSLNVQRMPMEKLCTDRCSFNHAKAKAKDLQSLEIRHLSSFRSPIASTSANCIKDFQGFQFHGLMIFGNCFWTSKIVL
jgi:hypothetical protein